MWTRIRFVIAQIHPSTESECLMQICVWSNRPQIKHTLTYFTEQEPVFDKDIYFIYRSLLNEIKQT